MSTHDLIERVKAHATRLRDEAAELRYQADRLYAQANERTLAAGRLSNVLSTYEFDQREAEAEALARERDAIIAAELREQQREGPSTS